MIAAKRESDFKYPIGMLGDCHRRIERFLKALFTVANDAKGGPLTNEQQSASAISLRYFRDAAPKHTADEEETLFPKLRRLRRPDLQPLLAKMDSLQQDHELAEKSHRKVEDLSRSWLANGRLSPQDAERLATVLRQLVELYSRHIAVEDTEVFPFAANVLPSSDRVAMGTEMATRRGVGTP
ncbi:MAG TPA: hemerythrin domain-containing protein [Candidatus Limnocylindrales bacterium]|nr:hemerythrin domain-containing protein [Candidatus Limnocylindrales bacterium]